VVLGVAIALVCGLAAVALLAGLGVIGNNRAVLASASNPNLVVNNVASTPNTLTVVGDGKVTVAPDKAELSLGVSATRPNVHDALTASNRDMTKLLASLHAQGVADPDLQTSAVSVDQVTSCCPSTVTGYSASNSLAVVVHHVSNVGGIIAAAVDAVGNDISIGGVTLSIGDPSTQLTAARAAAMKDAGARAQQWASNAGRQLGKLIAISEVVGSSPIAQGCTQGCGAGAGGGGGAVAIQSGLQTVEVTITVAYAISN
jgi:uncharacterized protein YggE